MKGFLRSNIFKVLLIVVVIFGGIIILSISTGTNTFSAIISRITNPMSLLADENLPKLGDASLDAMSMDEIKSAYLVLQEENKQLRNQLVDYYEVKSENQQYMEQLGISKNFPELDMVAATVTARDPADTFGGFSIDKGYLDGVSENDPVITDKGVVGLVSKVYASSSSVKTILNEDIKLGAVSKEFMENGVVESNIETANQGIVRMSYLTKDTKLNNGTIITTSGAGGTFPEGLIIGTVSYLGTSDKDVSMYAAVEPAQSIEAVSTIFVVTDFPGKGEESAPLYSQGETGEDGESGE